MADNTPVSVVPVVLCGGSGTRLWPLSRAGFPKQFLCLNGSNSLFQQALERLVALDGKELRLSPVSVVCNEEHRFLALEQMREADISPGSFVLEPVARNTAPALSLAALAALEGGDDPVLVVTPADQTVSERSSFVGAIKEAVLQALDGSLVILGVNPDRPESGYGYIKVDSLLGSGISSDWDHGMHQLPFSVARFVEKPDTRTAELYLEEGGYYWNAGIFVLKASVWLKTLARFRPDISQALDIAWEKRLIDENIPAFKEKLSFIRPGKAEFAKVPAESVDYAVMEPLSLKLAESALVAGKKSKAKERRKPGAEKKPVAEREYPQLKMVSLAAGWSDLGAWDAVWQILPKDVDNNAFVGDVLTVNSHNNLIHANNRMVALLGVDDMVVVETNDAVLVSKKSSAQDLKKLIVKLQEGRANARHASLTLHHRKAQRPWGWYDNIDESERFKVKRIQVNPGASLSLQKHHHRAEHWIVVRGTAEISNGEETFILTENQSTYIPLGAKHRLYNPGVIPLELIEVQSGSYLGEDDIVRYADKYGR